MDKQILQTVVKLTKLVNQLPINSNLECAAQSKKGKLLNTDFDQFESHEKKVVTKLQKKLTSRVFDKIIDLNKYVNPVNKKVLD